MPVVLGHEVIGIVAKDGPDIGQFPVGGSPLESLFLLGGKNMTNSYPFPVFGDEFKGKRVLVTGGTKGIGAAIVRRFELSGGSYTRGLLLSSQGDRSDE